MIAAVLVAAYLVGAIPFAVMVGRATRGVDVRRAGSGNAGAMNTLRTAGPAAGVLVALLDAGKGALAVLIGQQLVSPEVGALAGCAAVTGHCFSPYLVPAMRGGLGSHWKMVLRATGGKGLATGMGVLLTVSWLAAAVAGAAFAVTHLIQRKDVTLPSVIGSLAAAPAIWISSRNVLLTVAVLLVGIVVTIKHLPDLREAFWVESEREV
ncbi:MAG TPA: glycerol-3-phosphate acyltransferase [Herpetosiphonaceae bacterium]|nr:glycerol-3-phosphate acyltransferase [Herpetosiphonaceae bacterium]